MSYQVVIPVIISFVVSAVLGPIVIPFLRKLKVGQTEREELKSHLKKTGTPTMGGIIILASVILTSLIYVKDYPKIIPILFVTVGFGIVGFLDDYLKVVLKRSDGLLAWQKMLCQIVITAIFVFYILKFTDVSLTMLIPVFRWKISESWSSCDSGYVFSGNWNRQWSEFYGWSGRSGIQCHGIGSNLFYCGCSRNTQRN